MCSDPFIICQHHLLKRLKRCTSWKIVVFSTENLVNLPYEKKQTIRTSNNTLAEKGNIPGPVFL